MKIDKLQMSEMVASEWEQNVKRLSVFSKWIRWVDSRHKPAGRGQRMSTSICASIFFSGSLLVTLLVAASGFREEKRGQVHRVDRVVTANNCESKRRID